MSHIKNTFILVPVLRNTDSVKLPTAELKAHKNPRISTACILLLEELFKEQNCKTQFQLLEYSSFQFQPVPCSLSQEHKPQRRLCQGGWIRLSRAAAVDRNTAITCSWQGVATSPGRSCLLFPPIWTAPIWKSMREPLQ